MDKKVFSFIFALFFILFCIEIYDATRFADLTVKSYVDLKSVSEKSVLQDEDYDLIFAQTGLGRPAVEDLRNNERDFYSSLAAFQTQKTRRALYERCYLFFPTTTADVRLNEAGHYDALTLPPLKDGDILITKSTKTLVYRHGHAAIITDSENGRAIEAMMLGTASGRTNIDDWESYATLMVLRPKAKKEQIDDAVSFAEKKLLGIPYHLLAGFFEKDQSARENVQSTHCSHLVWQAYKSVGIDLDADGGWFVSPCDISGSQDIEVVFSYGFGEKNTW